MTVFLKLIELENFKSYKGYFQIGPLKPFTAIIGPNGSGKSNFMDAISFVMGEKSGSLRVRRLNELIHGSSIKKPIAERAWVKAIFQLTDGTEKSFLRSIEATGSTSEYKINDNIVTSAVYLADLEKLGINVRAKNFLVFQGAVESIATKKAEELTSLFEEISGSINFKADYDRLKAEILKVENEIQCSYSKKKEMVAEKREANLEMKQAEKYQRLKENYALKRLEFQLFCLHQKDTLICGLKIDRMGQSYKVEKMDSEKEVIEEILTKEETKSAQLQRELAEIEQDIREIEVAISKNKPKSIKIYEGIAHFRKKLESAEKSYKRAQLADETHQKNIRDLQEELDKIEKMKDSFEAGIINESQGSNENVRLEETQIHEYNRLKEESNKKSASYFQLLDSANREIKSDQDRLESTITRRTKIENKLKQKRDMRNEILRRASKLEEQINKTEDSLVNQTQLRDNLRSAVDSAKGKIQEVQRELENISGQLGDANIDQQELARTKRKAEIVENLKRLYSGVYARLFNMCEPIHKRYNVALTKVLGMYMDAIVVDSAKTAGQCVQYLKEQYLGPETFLALDYVQSWPIKERLRDIKEPANVKLLYDVLKFWPREIDPVILFATKNVLVCETSEDARKLAYDKQTRYDCIALDGTCYQKSGIMSGGSSDLAKRAKRWDDKEMDQLKLRKEKLTEELRDLLAISRKESDLSTIESQIRGCENSLKYTKADLFENQKEFSSLDKEIQELCQELETIQPSVEAIEKIIAEREREIRDIKDKMNNVEDEVYGDFCKRIGVSSIRQYEERELHLHQEQAQKRMEFENQCNRIQTQLEFEKQRDTKSNVSRWKELVQKAEEDLQLSERSEIDLTAEISKDEARMKQLELLQTAKKKKITKTEQDIEHWRSKIRLLTMRAFHLANEIDAIGMKIEKLIEDKEAILAHCTMEGITIPMMNSEDLESIIYNSLPKNLQGLEGEDWKIAFNNLKKAESDLHAALEKTHVPNAKAIETYMVVKEKFQLINSAFEKARLEGKKIRKQFEKIKKKRYDLFMPCFEHISTQIDLDYKDLTKNLSAQAFLEPENPEEPFIGGINYNCVPPGKRFQLIHNLSGGEKAIAALALLFAIHSFHPAPFFVLDEVDASLDNTNIGKLASYIREKINSLQTIMISLKDEFFSHADALIGISSEVAECLQSNVFTYDITTCDA
ncbi:structural maintenance of chromosomes protein 1A-like [Venturia canescens]|uniref:structural maintenance of chromosomes protein 1A-like n=1 Tax=Venturia canescens TaxID=32260 RepID=UPI001C9C5D5F|nr:structural maintenance of chromosomes protein 1A-like [Venturia canescens]